MQVAQPVTAGAAVAPASVVLALAFNAHVPVDITPATALKAV